MTVALVTGAARGIGRAIAVAFSRQGISVGLIDVCAPISGCPYPLGTLEQLQETARRCRNEGGAALALPADITDELAVSGAVGVIERELGPISVLANSAGIVTPGGRAAHEYGDDVWRLFFEINVLGACRVVRAVVPKMISRQEGSIINIASVAGLVGYASFAPYVASKHALVGLTKAMALDYAPHGIRVNAICPGSVEDDPLNEGRMLSAIAQALELEAGIATEAFARQYPTGRLLRAEEVASVAAMLASAASSGLTGAVIAVDGGYTSH